MEPLLRATSLGLVAVILFVLLLAATQVGRWIGRRQRDRGEDKEAGALATGMLGIFALLIAFTYSLSLARYDARRGMVLQEANAIGTTANYAAMLPRDRQPAVLAMLHDYTRVRIGLGAPYDEAKFTRDVQTSNRLLAGLWQQANAITAADPQSLPAFRFVSALNEQTNIAESRLTSLRNHVPVTVLIVVSLIAALSLGFAGYSAVLGGFSRYISLTIMAAAITLLITLTMDLDRPDRGSIEISVQPLRDALEALPSAG